MSEIKKIISSRFVNYDESLIDFVIQLNSDEIIPYGYNIKSHDDSSIANEITALLISGNIKPDKYSGPSKAAIEAAQYRVSRDRLLNKTDIFVSTPDYPLTDIQKTEIKAYRQQLRDITKQAGFPNNVVWPKIPDCIKDKVSQ